MEKDYLSAKKVVKNLRNYQKLKLWARVPATVSSCPAAAICTGELSELCTLL